MESGNVYKKNPLHKLFSVWFSHLSFSWEATLGSECHKRADRVPFTLIY